MVCTSDLPLAFICDLFTSGTLTEIHPSLVSDQFWSQYLSPNSPRTLRHQLLALCSGNVERMGLLRLSVFYPKGSFLQLAFKIDTKAQKMTQSNTNTHKTIVSLGQDFRYLRAQPRVFSLLVVQLARSRRGLDGLSQGLKKSLNPVEALRAPCPPWCGYSCWAILSLDPVSNQFTTVEVKGKGMTLNAERPSPQGCKTDGRAESGPRIVFSAASQVEESQAPPHIHVAPVCQRN